MSQRILIFFMGAVGLVGGPSAAGQAQKDSATYTEMAVVEQYLMDRSAEIALAQSAAPAAISRDADVWVLGRKGYERAVQGKNGFACIVQRSWAMVFEDPEFWNPKIRGAMCFNKAAAQAVMPPYLARTKMVMAGESKAQMMVEMKAGFKKKEFTSPGPGSMCYMMSSHSFLGDGNGNWHSHLMFLLPTTEATAWGAGLRGSPILVAQDPWNRMTIFLVPVGEWSDGSASPPYRGE